MRKPTHDSLSLKRLTRPFQNLPSQTVLFQWRLPTLTDADLPYWTDPTSFLLL